MGFLDYDPDVIYNKEWAGERTDEAQFWLQRAKGNECGFFFLVLCV